MVNFIGFGELVVIILAALLILGPQSLLRFARLLGRAYRSFSRFVMNLRSEITLIDLEKSQKEPGDKTPPPAG